MDRLVKRLEAVCDEQPFTTSWYLKDLVTGEEAQRLGDVPLPSASTRKVSIMMAAFRAAHAGRLDLAEPVTVRAGQQPGIISGVCQYVTPGLTFPLRDAILHMIITSDNVCTDLVTERLELEELNEHCRSLGMRQTVHRTKLPPLGLADDHPLDAVTTTTPADQGLLLDLILAGTRDAAAAERLGCSQEHCRQALQFLGWQRFSSMIPALLPFGTLVAHKTGMGQRGWMDVGIVFRDQQPLYILTAFTDGVPKVMPDGLPGHHAAFMAVARLSRLCWEAIG